jgi:Sulfotransferase family
MKAFPPVIIIGMGRSGTSIVTQLLVDLGLFVGSKKSPVTYEAIFFQQINKWLLASCGGGLENTAPMKSLLEDNEVSTFVTDFIRYVIKTPKAISFLGFVNYLKYHSPENLDVPWGWKDPRNTFTFPIWAHIFPDCKVIHVYRHGVDVANSLNNKRGAIVTSMKKRYKKFGRLYWLYWIWKRLPNRNELVDVRSSSLDGGFSLWEEYFFEARTLVKSLDDRALEVQFESLMAEPREILEKMAAFCGLEVSQIDIDKAMKLIRRERAYAYRLDDKLQNFAAKVHRQLSLYGY